MEALIERVVKLRVFECIGVDESEQIHFLTDSIL